VIQSIQFLIYSFTASAQNFVHEFMKSKGVDVTSLPWLPRRLYVAGSSPAEVREHLPPSHCTAAREIIILPPAEGASLSTFKTQQILPVRIWVHIKHGLYKGDIGFMEQSDATDAILVVAPRKRPYDLPQQSGEKSLFCNEMAILADLTLEPIMSPTGVDIGFTCGGHNFIYGLLRLTVPTHSVTVVELPHPDEIAFHMIADFERPFVEQTVHLFSAQFWRELDPVEIRRGDLHSSRGNLVNVEWHKRTASVSLHTVNIWGQDVNKEDIVHCSIEELRRTFTTGQAVRVIAGPYRGYTGHVIAAYGGTVSLQYDGQSPNVSVYILHFSHTVLTAKYSSRFPTYCWNHMCRTMSDLSVQNTQGLTFLFPSQHAQSSLETLPKFALEHTRELKPQ